MTTTSTASLLETNCRALGERNRDVVTLVQAAADRGGLVLTETPSGAMAGTLDGRAVCSRHDPMAEAARLTEDVDLVEHAVVVVYGFGLGYHVRLLAERMEKAGVIIVVEPDVELLASVLRQIDHAGWLSESLVVFVTDPDDRSALSRKLHGAESILAQGMTYLEHPASRRRLDEVAARFSGVLRDHVANAKLTLMTTLMRSVDTVRNLMANLDHYALGSGVADLAGAAKDRPAIIVSAGPSLQRNIAQLAAPGVRDRCVIIAVQTTLRPLLEAGITPHFVTALDYHEISRRFYEGLDAAQLEDVTLVADPKVNPVVLDVFPGPVRCCGNTMLDKVLGGAAREMGSMPGGATVAHLAFYLARHLQCDPIVTIGQDLGFTDGLYYAPGTAIHDVWAPELNPFNTIEMMEWQRIARHRGNLHRRSDINGRSIYTDAQMLAYLDQFERDFSIARDDGTVVIDASEGGVERQHVTVATLGETIAQFDATPLAPLPQPPASPDASRTNTVVARLDELETDIQTLAALSRQTRQRLERMIEDRDDDAKMSRHFEKVEQYRREVEDVFDAFEVLNLLNQLGVFRRLKADRRIHMQHEIEPPQRMKAQLDRDLENVCWLIDAAEEMTAQLTHARNLLRQPDRPESRRKIRTTSEDLLPEDQRVTAARRIAAMIPVPRDQPAARDLLQQTLTRLGRCEGLHQLIVITDDPELNASIDPSTIGRPVLVHRSQHALTDGRARAVASARRPAITSWRGGIAGMSVYDELLYPSVMQTVMEDQAIDAALLVGADWPLVDPVACASVIERHREHPDVHRLVFTQAPPGLCGCLVSRAMMGDLNDTHRLSTIGTHLVYQPHRPQGDPIGRDANVQIAHEVRRSLHRFTAQTPSSRSWLNRVIGRLDDPASADMRAVVDAADGLDDLATMPQHLIIETGTWTRGTGRFSRHRHAADRAPMTETLLDAILTQLPSVEDLVVTFDGLGDPLNHDAFDGLLKQVRAAGVGCIHLRSELCATEAQIDRLLAAPVDIISVDLQADSEATYQRMLGRDGYTTAVDRIQALIDGRPVNTDARSTLDFGHPWVVPRIERCVETIEDIPGFFDRWCRLLGTAIIDPAPDDDTLLRTFAPARVEASFERRTMRVLSDGRVTRQWRDAVGVDVIGDVRNEGIESLQMRRHESVT